jgi:hypothetical protein
LSADAQGAAVFHQAMGEWTRGVAPDIVASIDFVHSARVVDVGGGYGELLCAVLDAHPRLEGCVFDLAHARDGAAALFEQRGVASRASFVGGSFFEAPPPPADTYLLKSVIHDWDDARSRAILERCREAMSGEARLLLIEPPAPAPGLGQSGLSWIVAFSDLNMLVNTGGRERTEADYRALLRTAGLRVVAVRPTAGGYYSVFETQRG